jgi:hypothetical protein
MDVWVGFPRIVRYRICTTIKTTILRVTFLQAFERSLLSEKLTHGYVRGRLDTSELIPTRTNITHSTARTFATGYELHYSISRSRLPGEVTNYLTSGR